MYEIFEKLCIMHGITPYRFCKDNKVNTSTISTWKKNGSLARPELAKKVCEYFNVTLDYLMGSSFIEEMGHIIQEERIDQCISQNELAMAARLSPSDLDRYETGEKNIREDIFEDIARALGTSYYELIQKYDLHNEKSPHNFNGNIAKYEVSKKTIDKDEFSEMCVRESPSNYGSGSVKKNPALAKRLSAYRNLLILNESNAEKAINYIENLKQIQQLENEQAHLIPKAAHERTDIEVTEEMKKHDDAFFDE